MLKQKSKKSISPSLKGSVLFTVLVVSTILLIMMLTTITLAGVASKRAYNEYNDHQTITTARSVVDSVITSLKKDKDFGAKIITDLKASKSFLDVQVNGGNNLGEGFGTVDNLRFEYVGTDNNAGYYLTGSGKPIIKITATVTQSGVTSSYSQYVIGDSAKNGHSSSGGGFVAFGGFESSTSSTNPNVYAPAYIGIDAPTIDFDKTVKFHNNTLNHSTIVNSNLISNSDANFKLGRNEGPAGQNGGVTVTGNLVCDNPFSIEGNTPSSTDSTENMSYLYVGGTLDIYNASKLGMKDHPINIFCGRLVYERNSSSLNANIFCYNDGPDGRESVSGSTVSKSSDQFTALSGTDKELYAKKSWSYMGTNKTSLINWVESATTPTTNDKTYTGSFCTKGSLAFEGQVQIDGDIYVEKDLHITKINNAGDISIKGNVYVKGSLTAEGDNKDIAKKFLQGVTGTVYCNRAFDAVTDIDAAIKANKVKAYDTTTINTVCQQFLTGGLFESRTSLENNVIVTPATAKAGFTETVTEKDDHGNDVDVDHYKDAHNFSQIKLNTSRVLFQSGSDIKSVAYDAADTTAATTEPKTAGYDAVITGGCTLTGSMSNVKLLFKPSTDIWVNLYNLKLSNDCQFIIDDSAGKVNFFMVDLDKKNYAGTQDGTNKYKWIPETSTAYEDLLKNIGGSPSGGYANVFEISKLELMSLKYKTVFDGTSTINLVTNPTGADAWMVPGIGIYAGEGSKTKIQVNGDTTFTCDVYMPSGTYSAKVHGSQIVKDNEITWNGELLKTNNDNNMQLIGSLMVGTIDELQNDYKLAFVNDGSGTPPVSSSGETYQWNPVNGLADF